MQPSSYSSFNGEPQFTKPLEKCSRSWRRGQGLGRGREKRGTHPGCQVVVDEMLAQLVWRVRGRHMRIPGFMKMVTMEVEGRQEISVGRADHPCTAKQERGGGCLKVSQG